MLDFSSLINAVNSLTEIKEAFADSDILFRVELSDWNLISDNFKQCIDSEKSINIS